jgi:hypothetical protein
VLEGQRQQSLNQLSETEIKCNTVEQQQSLNQLSETEIKCNTVEAYYFININIKQQNKNVNT